MEGLPVIAIDFGASSIRVCRVDLEARPVALHVVHRYPHGPIRHTDGSLRWGRAFGGKHYQGAEAVGFDRAGNVVVVGDGYGAFEIDGTELTSKGSADVFVLQLASKEGPPLAAER